MPCSELSRARACPRPKPIRPSRDCAKCRVTSGRDIETAGEGSTRYPSERFGAIFRTPVELFAHPYAKFLDRVEKPTRYTGAEHGTRKKDWSAVEARVCLAFPDLYDIGMSHLG